MRIRRLGDQFRDVPPGRPIELFAPGSQVAGPGVTSLSLDIAAVVERGAALLVLGTPALAATGITAHPTLRTATDPVAPLELLVTAPIATPVPATEPVAIALVLDAPAESYYEDPSIDVLLGPRGLRFDSGR